MALPIKALTILCTICTPYSLILTLVSCIWKEMCISRHFSCGALHNKLGSMHCMVYNELIERADNHPTKCCNSQVKICSELRCTNANGVTDIQTVEMEKEEKILQSFWFSFYSVIFTQRTHTHQLLFYMFEYMWKWRIQWAIDRYHRDIVGSVLFCCCSSSCFRGWNLPHVIILRLPSRA